MSVSAVFINSDFSPLLRDHRLGIKALEDKNRTFKTWGAYFLPVCCTYEWNPEVLIHPSLCVCVCVLHLTGTSSDWCSRLQGGLMGRGLVANQYASTAVRAPMPTSVEVGRERKKWPSSSISGILRPLIISWACIFSIRVELSSAGKRHSLTLDF